MNETESIPAVLDVTLQVPIDTLLQAWTVQPGPWRGPDDVDGPPPAVRDLIGERVAQLLFTSVEKDIRAEISTQVKAQIEARVREVIEEALNGEIQTTNEYGEPRGPKLSLRAMIVKSATEWFTKPTGDYRNKSSQGADFIRKAVDQAIKEDLAQALKDAREQITEQIRQKAAEAIAATVAGMAGIR